MRYTQAPARPAEAHRRRTFFLLDHRRYDLACAEARAWLAETPGDPTAHGVLAVCLTGTGRLADAVACAETATALAPERPFGHYARAYALLKLNRYEAAAAAIGEAIRLDPGEPDYHHFLAVVRTGQERWEDALAAAGRALALAPEHAGALNVRSLALRELGLTDEARAAVDAALAKDPEDDLAHANAGWARLDAGDLDGALAHFRESLRIEPTGIWAREGLARAMRGRLGIGALLLPLAARARARSPATRAALAAAALLAAAAGLAAVRAAPALAPVIGVLAALAAGTAVLAWTADRLFDALAQIAARQGGSPGAPSAPASEGLLFLAAAAFGLPGLARGDPAAVAVGLAALALLPPLHAASRCAVGLTRRIMVAYAAATGLAGAALVALAATRWPAGGPLPAWALWLGAGLGAAALLAPLAARGARALPGRGSGRRRPC